MKQLLIIFVLVTLAFPVLSHAQSVTPAAATTNTGKFVLLTNIPALQNLASNNSINSFAALTNNLYKICIGIAATLAVLQIMLAGFMYMSAGDNTERVSQARSKISAAILGLVLVLSPVIVFSVINPRILDLSVLNHDISNITPTGATNPTSAATAAGANVCSQYTNPTIGASCPVGQTQIDNSCCAGIQSGNVCCSGTGSAASTGSSGLNITAAVNWLDSNALATSAHVCLAHIQQALVAGGLGSLSCPAPAGNSGNWANECNPALQADNFTSLGTSDPSPKAGDIIVIQPYLGKTITPPNTQAIGHIAMYDGSHWVSDFVQNGPDPYSVASPVQYWRP